MYMAVPSGNAVIPDKMQTPTGAAVALAGGGSTDGGVGWYPDERDSFISWLRGEFAAANAIIDSMCHHLKSVGESGEYDGVIGSIQQRRCNWNPVLHMQQYFSVAEVVNALNQAAWRRQHPHRSGAFAGSGKDFKRSGGVGFRQGQGYRAEFAVKDGHNSNAEFKTPRNGVNGSGNLPGTEVVKSGDKDVEVAKYSDGLSTKPQPVNNAKSLDSQSTLSESLECGAKEVENPNSNGCTDAHLKGDLSSMHTPQQKKLNIAKTFVCTEISDGKTVNVVDGMKMYEELFDDSGVGKMVRLVNDLRAAGRRGQFQGHTFIVSKRPMKGHGREMIQFGVPIVDTPFDDEAISGTFKDRKIEAIPSLFQEYIDRLMAKQILTVKPDSCIIDIYNEGDHSQPHLWPHWFGRPICVLFLTECDITFGRVIGFDHFGDYKGSFKFSLSPGSMLVMEGKSADYAKHAIPSIRKQRILVTLTKSQPRRASPAPVAPPSHWIPPLARSPNHVGPKHYVQTTGVLPAPAPNSIQPVFVPAAAMTYPPPVVAGWAAAPPLRQHAPPGTGVFLPPGSASSVVEKENDENTPSPKQNPEDSKGSLDENGGKRVVAEEE